jgi:hypothetical protein
LLILVAPVVIMVRPGGDHGPHLLLILVRRVIMIMVMGDHRLVLLIIAGDHGVLSIVARAGPALTLQPRHSTRMSLSLIGRPAAFRRHASGR